MPEISEFRNTCFCCGKGFLDNPTDPNADGADDEGGDWWCWTCIDKWEADLNTGQPKLVGMPEKDMRECPIDDSGRPF